MGPYPDAPEWSNGGGVGGETTPEVPTPSLVTLPRRTEVAYGANELEGGCQKSGWKGQRRLTGALRGKSLPREGREILSWKVSYHIGIVSLTQGELGDQRSARDTARRIRRGDVSRAKYRRQRSKEERESGKNPTLRCKDEGISVSGQETRTWIRGSVERHKTST
jgi:hypothetical protein